MSTGLSDVMSDKPLSLLEELHVLLLDRQAGGLIDIDDRKLRYAFAGAALMDLARENRIDTDLESLSVIDSTALDDEILNPLISVISRANEQPSIIHWIERFAAPEIANQIRRSVAERLVRRGILGRDPGGGIYLDKQVERTRRYPGVSGPEGQDVVLRVMNVIFSDDIPTPDETMLVALVDTCGIFENLLTKSEVDQRHKRIALVRDLDLIGNSIRNAILAVSKPESEHRSMTMAFLGPAARGRAKRPPMAPGALPVIGHSLRLRPVPTKPLADCYRSLGPVFRIRDLASEFTVLAGPEANLFCQKNGHLLFRSHDTYTPLFGGMDAQRIILSMDGEEHFKLRRAISSGFSGERFLARLPRIREIILGELPDNGSVVAVDAFTQLTAKSIGLACTGYVLSTAQVNDMEFFMRRLIAASVLRILPRFMLFTPRARRAKTGFFDVFTGMLSARLDSKDEEGRGDVLDAMLELHRANPQFLPEQELRVSCLGPIFSGLHTTASAGASAMYLLLKHRDVQERARAEAVDLYANEGPTPEKLNALDVISRTVLETLRMYNPFGSIFRRAVNTFEFGGYTIPAGTRLFLPISVPHCCPEFFPEPDRFDIDRYLPGRAEHKRAGVYMPFGFGTHRCLGSAIADAHLKFALATILHHTDVELEPPDYEMKIIMGGVPSPTRRFRLKFAHR